MTTIPAFNSAKGNKQFLKSSPKENSYWNQQFKR